MQQTYNLSTIEHLIIEKASIPSLLPKMPFLITLLKFLPTSNAVPIDQQPRGNTHRLRPNMAYGRQRDTFSATKGKDIDIAPADQKSSSQH